MKDEKKGEFMKQTFSRCGLKVFSALRAVLYWLSGKALDTQVYCSNRTGDEPF
ncbi:MAG: hypothetical protein IJU44_09745 [Kiritimatiellae bacterium]|nr:hypothetical protein [Kiritimatiellia bacterium]